MQVVHRAHDGPLRSRDVDERHLNTTNQIAQCYGHRRISFFSSALCCDTSEHSNRVSVKLVQVGCDCGGRLFWNIGANENNVSVLGDDFCRRSPVMAAITGDGAPGDA